MKVASSILSRAKLDAFFNQKTKRFFLIINNDGEEMKINIENGRELAYLIRFFSRCLAFNMKRAKKYRDEIIDAVCQHAKAGAYEELQDMPIQTTLEELL